MIGFTAISILVACCVALTLGDLGPGSETALEPNQHQHEDASEVKWQQQGKNAIVKLELPGVQYLLPGERGALPTYQDGNFWPL
jgi:hypothetical protein